MLLRKCPHYLNLRCFCDRCFPEYNAQPPHPPLSLLKKHVTAIIVTSTAWQWPQSLTAVSSHVSSLHMQWSVSICNSSSSFWMQWYRRAPKHATTAERTLAVVYNVTWYYSTAQPFSVDQSAKVLWANTNLSAYLTVICRGLHTVIHYDH